MWGKRKGSQSPVKHGRPEDCGTTTASTRKAIMWARAQGPFSCDERIDWRRIEASSSTGTYKKAMPVLVANIAHHTVARLFGCCVRLWVGENIVLQLRLTTPFYRLAVSGGRRKKIKIKAVLLIFG